MDENKENNNLDDETIAEESASNESESNNEANIDNKVEDQIQSIKDELDKQKDIFLRTVAEYENYRKRSDREKRSIYNDAVADTIATILPIADSLDFAIKAQDGATEEYQKGLQMIRNQLNKAFEILKVKPIGKVGDQFDPNLHNAISHIEDDNVEDNTIIEVFQKGYMVSEKMIRHAMVKVAN